MPAPLTHPGVYIEELPSGVRTITGVATSITAFVGATLRGPLDTPTRVQSFAEFERGFGGLWRESPLTYAVQQFFQNGGADALIVRVANSATPATGAADSLTLIAASPGEWGERLRVRVDHQTRPEVGTEQLFNLTVRDAGSGATERFLTSRCCRRIHGSSARCWRRNRSSWHWSPRRPRRSQPSHPTPAPASTR